MIRLSPYLLEHMQSTAKHSTYLLNAHTCNLAPVNAPSPSPQFKTKGVLLYTDFYPHLTIFTCKTPFINQGWK
jgi:hypothetical protein